MTEEQVSRLVFEAHQIFGQTSIYEVMDMDLLSAMMTLVDFYGHARKDDLERYLGILDQIREDEEGGIERRKGF